MGAVEFVDHGRLRIVPHPAGYPLLRAAAYQQRTDHSGRPGNFRISTDFALKNSMREVVGMAAVVMRSASDQASFTSGSRSARGCLEQQLREEFVTVSFLGLLSRAFLYPAPQLGAVQPERTGCDCWPRSCDRRRKPRWISGHISEWRAGDRAQYSRGDARRSIAPPFPLISFAHDARVRKSVGNTDFDSSSRRGVSVPLAAGRRPSPSGRSAVPTVK